VFKTSCYMILLCLLLFTNETSFPIRHSELFTLKIIYVALNFLVCMTSLIVHRGLWPTPEGRKAASSRET
jgi:hypothetical protein